MIISTVSIDDYKNCPIVIAPPQPESNCSIVWHTDLQISYNGDETRQCLTPKPRHKIEYTFKIPDELKREFDINVFKNIRSTWFVPLWNEAVYVGSVHTTDDYNYIYLRVNPFLMDAESGDYILLIDGKTLKFQIVKMSSYGSNSLSCQGYNVHVDNCYAMPVKVGIVSGDISKEQGVCSNIYTITFLTKGHRPPKRNLNIPTANIVPIYPFDNTGTGSSTTVTISQLQHLIDFEIGDFIQRTPHEYAQQAYEIRHIFTNNKDLYNFLAWIHFTKGRYKTFWIDSQTQAFNVVNEDRQIGSIIKTTDLFINNAPFKTYIKIHYINSTSEIVKISARYDKNTHFEIRLDANIKKRIDDIAYISFVSIARYNTDTIKIKYLGNSVTECIIPILEFKPTISLPEKLVTETNEFYVTEKDDYFFVTE